ncbi:hypothetical protein FTX61_27620, partial [Nitriliruptoraceae bacterium ZYF776]|nr:hypothetical protein [Profundirhabdus halotolerans]
MKKEESQDKSKYPETYDNMVATTYFKDGSSDSDSSAILNEDNNMAAIADGHQINESKEITGDDQNAYEPQFVKIEEHNFFSGDESCNFFSDDQA